MSAIRKDPDTPAAILFREFIDKHVSVDDIAADFAILTPYQRLSLLEKFASFVWPKMKAVAMEVSHSEPSEPMLSLVRHLSEPHIAHKDKSDPQSSPANEPRHHAASSNEKGGILRNSKE